MNKWKLCSPDLEIKTLQQTETTQNVSKGWNLFFQPLETRCLYSIHLLKIFFAGERTGLCRGWL